MRLEYTSQSKELPAFMIDFVDYLLGQDGLFIRILTHKLKSSPLKGGSLGFVDDNVDLNSQVNYSEDDS